MHSLTTQNVKILHRLLNSPCDSPEYAGLISELKYVLIKIINIKISDSLRNYTTKKIHLKKQMLLVIFELILNIQFFFVF